MASIQRRRKGSFRKGVDADEGRRKREDLSMEIRKAKRESSLMKKRSVDFNPDDGKEYDSVSVNILVQNLHSPNPEELLNCLRTVRKVLASNRDPPIDEVIESGAVPRLVELLASPDPAMQFEAAWALTNIASGTSEHTKAVVNFGAVPRFRDLILSASEDVREQAVWALGNIAGDSAECRDIVLEAGCMQPLLVLLQNPNPGKASLIHNAAWTLSNFCRGKPQPEAHLVEAALPVLAYLLTSHDPEVLTDACWALSYLTDGPDERIQAAVNHNVVPRVVELLGSSAAHVQTPALRTVGNIVTGNEAQTDMVIQAGALPHLRQLLDSPKRNNRREACWTVSNITAGVQRQIQAVIDEGIVPKLILLLEDASFDVRKEAVWVFSNSTTGGNSQQTQYLVQQGCLRPLCNLLDSRDTRVLQVTLDALDNILKVGEELKPQNGGVNMYASMIEEIDGLTKIENLQHHQNQRLYDTAVKVIEKYYGVEEYVDAGGAPGVTAEGDMFAFGVNAPAGANPVDGSAEASAQNMWGSFGGNAQEGGSSWGAGPQGGGWPAPQE